MNFLLFVKSYLIHDHYLHPQTATLALPFTKPTVSYQNSIFERCRNPPSRSITRVEVPCGISNLICTSCTLPLSNIKHFNRAVSYSYLQFPEVIFYISEMDNIMIQPEIYFFITNKFPSLIGIGFIDFVQCCKTKKRDGKKTEENSCDSHNSMF
jgi:hypothetical protein